MELKEEDWYLVLGLVIECETKGRSKVPRVAIVPREAYFTSQVI